VGFFVGFDGGLTKTALALCDTDGRLLGRLRGPGTAVIGTPTEQFFATAGDLLDGLCRQAGVTRSAIAHAVVGLSGIDFNDEVAAQHRAIAEGLGFDAGSLTLVNDGVVAIWGATNVERAAIVQHGSGITMAYRTALGRETVFDSIDVAAAFDLRREVVARVARMIDGRSQATGLMDRVLDSCGVAADEFVEWIARRPEARQCVSLLATTVFDAWRAGDAAAAELVQRAIDDYVIAIGAMAARMGESPLAAVFGGGVIHAGGAELQQHLATRLAEAVPHAHLVPVALSPELGALVLAGHRSHLDARALFERLLEQRGAP
jgi:N-acetylglucosamine kinase-like BadF-type ATPase